MAERTQTRYVGCSRVAVSVILVLWLLLAPAGTLLASKLALKALVAPNVITAIASVVTAALLIPPCVGIALLVRRRMDWQTVAALASSGAAIGGYLLIAGLIQAALPSSSTSALYGEGAEIAAAKLGLLLPYTLLAAWLTPHLAGAPRHRRAQPGS